MKRLIVTVVVLISLMPSYARDSNAKFIDPDAKVDELVSSVERWRWLPWKLNTALMHLDSEISKSSVSDKALRDMTRRLTKIYYSLSDVMMSIANKKRIIELVGVDNGPEAHEFFLQVLSDTNVEYRDKALRTIYPKGVHGDDLYEKIKSLENANAFPKAKSLMYLKLANPERALKEIQDFLGTTQDLEDYIKVGINMSFAYRDPRVIDVVFDRYPEFRNKPGGAAASGVIDWDSLNRYLQSTEGERFGKAMTVFADKDILDDDNRSLLFLKLKSKDHKTRKAVGEYLIKQVSRPTMPKEELLRVLNEAHAIESDAEIRKTLIYGVNVLRKKNEDKK